MADHYNKFSLKQFAGIVADCMEISLPETFAPGVPWLSKILKERMGGKADRAVLYHADAVGLYMWQQYTELFAPVYQHTSIALPLLSTLPSVTPVAHASMYTGLDPEQHGIQAYVRPKLSCVTLYDVLIRAGLHPGIVCFEDSSFTRIFAERDMDYYVVDNYTEVRKKVLELIDKDCYDVLSIHTFDYDTAAHSIGPESKEAINALAGEAEVFGELAKAIEEKWAGKHRTLISYSPDHGQHPLEGGGGTHGSDKIEDMNIVHFFGAKH